MPVDDADEAVEIATSTLRDEYASVTVEEPHRDAHTWVVEATADGERVNVHVNQETGETRVAHIED